MTPADAARRWASAWKEGWESLDPEPIVAIYAMNAVLSNARKFSGREAYEVWRVMQLIATNRPCAGVPDAVIQLAMRCKHFPEVWKVVATKALAHERRAGKRNSYR